MIQSSLPVIHIAEWINEQWACSKSLGTASAAMSLSLDKKEEIFQETGQQQLVNIYLVCGCLYHDFIIVFNILSTIIYKHRFPRLFGSLTSKTKSSQNSSIFLGDHHYWILCSISEKVFLWFLVLITGEISIQITLLLYALWDHRLTNQQKQKRKENDRINIFSLMGMHKWIEMICTFSPILTVCENMGTSKSEQSKKQLLLIPFDLDSI